MIPAIRWYCMHGKILFLLNFKRMGTIKNPNVMYLIINSKIIKWMLSSIFSCLLLPKICSPGPWDDWSWATSVSCVFIKFFHNHPNQLADYLHVGKVLNFNLITGFLEKRNLCSTAVLHSSLRGRKIASQKRGEWYLINYWFLLNYSRQAIIDIDGTDISLCLVPKWKEISHFAICLLEQEMVRIFNFK